MIIQIDDREKTLLMNSLFRTKRSFEKIIRDVGPVGKIEHDILAIKNFMSRIFEQSKNDG